MIHGQSPTSIGVNFPVGLGLVTAVVCPHHKFLERTASTLHGDEHVIQMKLDMCPTHEV